MQLTTFTDYGLRSLMFLAANPDRQCCVREIAEHYAVSYNHLVKVVHRLAQLGYVQSAKGKGGGIRLAKDAASITLAELIQALEPTLHLAECFDRASNTCRITEHCRLKHYLFEARRAFLASLGQRSLADCVSPALSVYKP